MARSVAAALSEAVVALRCLTRVDHKLRIHVVPHPTVSCGPVIGFAAFVCPSKPPADYGNVVDIHIGAGFARIMKQHGATHAEAVEAVIHNLMHEVAHYEQWRDGRTCSERGVNVRATSLAKGLNRVLGRSTTPPQAKAGSRGRTTMKHHGAKARAATRAKPSTNQKQTATEMYGENWNGAGV